MLALDPWAVVGPGFQLSFVAVAAIHGLAPRLRAWLEGTAIPLRLCAPLAISLACTLATAPVALVHFGRTSLVASLPANLLALPAVAPLLWLALAACVLWPVAPGAAARARRRGARARRLHRAGRAARRLARRRAARTRPARLLAGGALAWLVLRRTAAALAGALAGLALALAWPSARASPAPPRALRVTFLDVGQGDATLIEAPGLRALVDTGPPGARVERQLRRRGVDSLDALFLSHDQLDHDGRAAAIVRALRVELLVTPALPGHQREPRGRDGRRPGARHPCAERAGRASCSAAARSSSACSDRDAPTPATPANDAALVVLARQGACSFLLPADAESPVLLDRRPGAGGRARGLASRLGRRTELGRLLEQTAAAAGRDLGRRAQHLRPSCAGDAGGLARAGVPVRRTDREGDIALACP